MHNKINIFETLGRTTSRHEVFHTQYLADALTISLEGDRSLFDQVWQLVAPVEWDVPEDATVVSEKVLHGGRRIDLLIADPKYCRVVGVEVKTVDTSAQLGQLTHVYKHISGTEAWRISTKKKRTDVRRLLWQSPRGRVLECAQRPRHCPRDAKRCIGRL